MLDDKRRDGISLSGRTPDVPRVPALTPAEYTAALHKAWLIAGFLRSLPTASMLEQIAHTEAVAPMLDPTLFAKGAARLREDRQLLELLDYVRRKIEKLPSVAAAVAAAEPGVS